MTERTVREVVVLKCSQSGGTENLLLNTLRYSLARSPVPTIYVGAQQEAVEAFLEERIIPGLRASDETREQMKLLRRRGTELYWPSMMMAATWSRSTQGLKTRPVGLVLADEVSIWPENSLDKLRKRTLTWPEPMRHIAIVSSPDAQSGRASDKDPIFVEWDGTDRREYCMRFEPSDGHPAPDGGVGIVRDADGSPWWHFVMGGPDSGWGLKWDPAAKRPDGTWDLDAVRRSAYYLTPDGRRLDDRARNEIIQPEHAKWIPTVPQVTSRRGYRVSAFMLPWVPLGDIAAGFLEAKAKGSESLKVFVFETLAERWHDEKRRANDAVFLSRQGGYQKGTRGEGTRFMTCDVQKDCMWWVAREWAQVGAGVLRSRLLEWGKAPGWDQVDEFAAKHDVARVLGDSGYKPRRTEMYIECARRKMIPTKGSGRDLKLPWQQSSVDPYEGISRSEALLLIVFQSDLYKSRLMDAITRQVAGLEWSVYDGIELTYCQHMSAEEEVGGTWLLRAGRPNHLWDCEVLQILACDVFLPQPG